jgi:hypothetical protein
MSKIFVAYQKFCEELKRIDPSCKPVSFENWIKFGSRP